jgi:hypothetical protein
VPATQVTPPVQPIPPHWPNSGIDTVVPVGAELVVALDVGMLVEEQSVVVPVPAGYELKNT